MKSARYVFVAVMGAWMGLAGVEHGVGEILQGNIAVEGIMIRSWPNAAFFQNLGGEPAMTILPNMLWTGILAVVFSLLFIGWAIFFAPRKHGGLVLILLAIPMLLFGGGIFPPLLGALVGAAATRLRTPTSPRPVSGLGRFFGQKWGWIFTACCVAWLALLPGVAALGFFFGMQDERVILVVIAVAFALLPLAYWSSVQRDRLQARKNSIKNPTQFSKTVDLA